MNPKYRITNNKYLIAGFYRAGQIGIRQLINIGVPRKNILVQTYRNERNSNFIEFLDQEDIEYFTEPINSNSSVNNIESFNPDILCSLYYRDKIERQVLEIPTFGGFNLHPSLLPKYRGVLSVPWAIVEGEQNTGYTYHYLSDELDVGKIIVQRKVKITSHDSAYSLYHRIIHAAMNDFISVVIKIMKGDDGRPQEGEPSYHTRGDLPNGGRIDNSWSDDYIERFIRAMYYPPFDPAIAEFDGVEYKVTSKAEYDYIREHGFYKLC